MGDRDILDDRHDRKTRKVEECCRFFRKFRISRLVVVVLLVVFLALKDGMASCAIQPQWGQHLSMLVSSRRTNEK
jgi:hypothetical protein